MAADVTGWLDRLAETLKAATPGPWRVAYPFTKLVDVPDREAAITAERPADAAAIVAAHNALPQLVAALRGVLEVCAAADERCRDLIPASVAEEHIASGDHPVRVGTIRSAVAAALGAEVTGR